MATYKVPQDVEAEDKLLGPLTFKQFIFLMIAAGAALMSWVMFSVQPIMAIIPVPIIFIFGGLAVFRREDQPVERYLLSFFNYTLRPRSRIWSTEGYYDHLVITAPKKKAAPELKSNLNEVHGQLEKLAQIVDTRGWSTKQTNLVRPGQTSAATDSDDRLFTPEAPATTETIPNQEDIMDDSNPEASHIDDMLQEQTQRQRQELMERVREQAGSPDAKQPQNLHYDPYPSSMHQRRINPDGTGNIAQTPTWSVYKEGQKLNSYSNEQEAYTAMATQQGDKITDAEDNDVTAALKEKYEPVQQQVEQNTSDIMELSGELKVSQIADKINRQPEEDDQSIKEGEEIKLR